MAAGRFAVLPLLTCLVAQAEPAVLVAPGLGSRTKVWVSGRVLKERPAGSSRTLSRNLKRLLAPNWVGAPLEVQFQGRHATAVSGADGAFEVELGAEEGGSFSLGVHSVEVRVPGAAGRSAIEVVAENAPFIVVSDFDDTLAVTNVTSTRGLVSAALLQDADTQPPVPGMSRFYRCLGKKGAPRPSFALVSGSPVQYVPRTAAFLARHQFPFFGMYLRDLGPQTLSDYKQPVLRGILRRFPHPLVLVGDSGEKDPEVYAEIEREFPGRVARVYIRDAGGSTDRARFDKQVLFRDATEALADAEKSGLASGSCPENSP